jgi:hypothetical protein
MLSNNKKLIAVFGATGQQGGGVLNRQGHNFSFTQVPADGFATLFPVAAETAAMFRYFEAHTYLGSESRDRIALANKIAGRQPTEFSTWARLNVPVQNL